MLAKRDVRESVQGLGCTRMISCCEGEFARRVCLMMDL